MLPYVLGSPICLESKDAFHIYNHALEAAFLLLTCVYFIFFDFRFIFFHIPAHPEKQSYEASITPPLFILCGENLAFPLLCI